MSKGRFSLEAIFKGTDRITAPIAKIKNKLNSLGDGATKGLRQANKVVDAGTRQVGRFSAALGVGAVLSVATLGMQLEQTIREGVEFERTMTFAAAQFPGMIRAGTEEFKALELAAKLVGDETEFSAQQAAEGLTLLATAGLSAENAIAALPKLVNFAMASKVDFARASDIANDAMGAFSLTTADAAKNAKNMSMVMDVLTRAAADSTTNVEELFEAVSVGGPIAKTAGASLQEFVGMSGVLAKVGLKGAEAGTAIRNAFLELGSPSSAATKGLKKLGVQVAVTDKGAIDMTATIGRFAAASKKMTKAQKIQALGSIFGSRTVGPFIALMDAGVDVIGEMTKSLTTATGTTEGMATVLQGDALGALRQFDSLISGLRLDIFDAVREPMLEIVKATGAWVTANRDLIKTKASEWAITLKDNLPAIWTWTVRISMAFAVWVGFAVAVKTLTLAVQAYEVATKIATGVTWAWGLAMKGGALASSAVSVATVRARVATVGLKVAQLASRSATLLATAAMWAYKAPLGATLLSTVRLVASTIALKVAHYANRTATLLSTAATVATRAPMVIATTAQGAYAAVIATTSGGLAAFKAATLATIPAIGAQIAAMAPILITLGAVTAAVLALVAAWKQITALSAELSGSGGITGTIGKMVEMGTFDPFAAHDAAMNEKARAQARERERPQIVSPAARVASESAAAGASSATVDGRIVVEAQQGTKAAVKAQPRNVKLDLQPSGAF